MLGRLRTRGSAAAALARAFAERERAVDAGTGVICVDPDGVIAHWSRGAEQLWGWRAEEAVGQRLVQLLMPSTLVEESLANIARMTNGETLEGEVVMRRKDSTQVLLWAHRAPVFHRDEVAGILGVAVALDDKRKAYRALVESEAMNWSILRAALDAIVAIDQHGRVLEFNPAAERMFGHARESVLGRELAELIIPPRHRQAHREGLARARDGRPGRILDERLEATALRADGSEFPVELTITRMHGEPPRFAGFARDLTERVQAERRLAQLVRRPEP